MTARPGAGQLGDAELAGVGALLSDRARCRVLLALNDGRSLPASVLADEAGVARSTASGHLAQLTDAGLLAVETHGRHRYYRLSGPHVGELLEQILRLAPTRPVRSLREGTRAAQLRAARTCYDHLAGRLGADLMKALLTAHHLEGGDGVYDPETADHDRPSAYGHDIDYTLTSSGRFFLEHSAGVKIPDVPQRILVRYCVDWTEQRHHASGPLGRALLAGFLDADWIRRRDTGRSISVTRGGRAALSDLFGVAFER
ncbi:MAG TPA: metalloregulator ArsR/SmtB family transcription factor [Actinocrinis sp.]